MWHGNIYVDHCAMEGLSSSGNIQGVLANALISILKHHSVDAGNGLTTFASFECPLIQP